jgi:hypothetical protein
MANDSVVAVAVDPKPESVAEFSDWEEEEAFEEWLTRIPRVRGQVEKPKDIGPLMAALKESLAAVKPSKKRGKR